MLLNTFAIITLFTVRLVDGPTIYEGRVEVQNNGVWGTVCDSGWDLLDAQVLCRQLGFGKAVAAIRNSPYGQSTRQNWLANLYCVGTEQTIKHCASNPWRYGYYSCSRLAGVKCSSGNFDFTL